ncbi:MAG: hypothetical protein ACYTEQ_14390 [Planctomycetota bacterium]|jgi:hypothetical protein
MILEYEQKGIQVLTPSVNATVAGNFLNNTTLANAVGIQFSGSDKVTIVNNHLQCNGGSAIFTNGLSDIAVIAGNYIDAPTNGIDIREVDGANTEIILGTNNILNAVTADRNDATTSGLMARVVRTFGAADTTPSVATGEIMSFWLTGGAVTFTDFEDGIEGQIIVISAEHNATVTDGTNIFLNGSADFDMTATDTLTLFCKADGKWYETARSDSGA